MRSDFNFELSIVEEDAGYDSGIIYYAVELEYYDSRFQSTDPESAYSKIELFVGTKEECEDFCETLKETNLEIYSSKS